MQLHSAIFYTKDIQAVEDFYTNKLGFTIDSKSEDRFISFAIGNSGHLGIKRQVETREIPGHQSVFILIDNIEAYYKELSSKGLNILKPLTNEQWATEFTVLDPDGNKLLFRS